MDHDAERAAAVGMQVNGFNFEGMDSPGMDYALNRWALTCSFGRLMQLVHLGPWQSAEQAPANLSDCQRCWNCNNDMFLFWRLPYSRAAC